MNYIIYFLITIVIIVFVHEFGHFVTAKLTGMRVDIFTIGFGKRLFGWNKLNGFTFGDLPEDWDGQGNTDYRLSLLPLGGYVKIAGMVDESFDIKFADKKPEPYEFRSKSTWKKVIVICGGVTMNLLLAFLVFWAVNFFQPKQYVKTTTVGYVAENTPVQKAGFEKGDKLISINDEPVIFWDDVYTKLFINNIGKDINVNLERNGEIKNLSIPRNSFSPDMKKGLMIFPTGFKVFIGSVIKNTPAEQAGLKAGDVFLKINNIPIYKDVQISNIISSNKEKQLPMVLLRDKDTIQIAVTPDKTGKIGIGFGEQFTGKVEYKSYGFFKSFWFGITDIGKYTELTFSMLKNVIAGNVAFSSAFGGPVKIAQFAAKSADTGFSAFIYFLAMLSLSLAILNILPFPVLDGGHLVIILVEGIIKKEIPIKIKMAIQNTGFVLLILLMAFIIYNDLISL
ncbi:MAG: RIP metalloprotease RseP [Ignavibacteriales bacterium]|nr:RIP metalloprotease RseP [Ignavibacteriales bacterium]